MEIALNLSLSGMAFYGADVGGFGGDAEDENYSAWFKALFLFPFFRNHCAAKQKKQEPWEMGDKTLDTARRYIKARYALLPYLYNLFIAQEEKGSPIITPLLYHFDGYPYVDDQFMVGDSIMQAPIMTPGNRRKIEIPEGRWFDICQNCWIDGPLTMDYQVNGDGTPVFVREGSIIPIRKAGRCTGGLNEVDFVCFVGSEKKSWTLDYRYDEGNGFLYREQGDGTVAISISVSNPSIVIKKKVHGPGAENFKERFFIVGQVSETGEPGVEIPFAGSTLVARPVEAN